MILENPYIMSITFFGDNGQMKLNLFSVKGITIELSEELRDKTRSQGSIFLHAENENALYTIMYLQNEYGSYYVATRNDYVFVSDMIAYYQIPENSFMITDSYNVTQRIEQNDIALMSERARENISSIIGRYAYYKQEPAFSIDAQSSLIVSMVSRNYPNYFELVLISFTALMIVVAQRIIILLIHLFKKMFPMVFARKEDLEDKKAASIINKSMVQDDRQLAYEGLSLENVLQYNESMKNDSSDRDNFYAEKSSDRAVAERIVPFFGVGSVDLDEEFLDEVDETTHVNDALDSGYENDSKINSYQDEDVQDENLSDDNYVENGYSRDITDNQDLSDNNYNNDNNSFTERYEERREYQIENQEQTGYVASSSVQNDISDISKKEVKKYNNRSVDDIFASFDNLLESIISKAEQNSVEHDGSSEKEE